MAGITTRVRNETGIPSMKSSLGRIYGFILNVINQLTRLAETINIGTDKAISNKRTEIHCKGEPDRNISRGLISNEISPKISKLRKRMLPRY